MEPACEEKRGREAMEMLDSHGNNNRMDLPRISHFLGNERGGLKLTRRNIFLYIHVVYLLLLLRE
jgi:hypothetical protein